MILRNSRREILWLGVTAHPSAQWIARQLTEAYSWQQAPRYIVRDRDCVYGDAFIRRLRAMGIRDRPIAPRSPWQNGYAERLIGSIRRDCLDHVVVLGDRLVGCCKLDRKRNSVQFFTDLSDDRGVRIGKLEFVVPRTIGREVESLGNGKLPRCGRALQR
jgi:transposase InsO family protein